MVDRLAMAKQYVQEMLEKRDDIVGAFVVGSVARGDASEGSDIDLGLVAEGMESEVLERAGIDTWRDGVYIEAALAPVEQYADVNKVLLDKYAATQMNDALILYDPEGILARVQEGVRAVYMEPCNLGMRVHPILNSLHESLVGLEAAAAAGDLVAVCSHVAEIGLQVPQVPLLLKGISPSSSKPLAQLERVSPELKDRICQWLGSAPMGASDVRALLPVIQKCLSYGEAQYPEGAGGLPRYFAEKAAWMADNGLHHDALATTWGFLGFLTHSAAISDDAKKASDIERLVRKWLKAVGWEGQEVLEKKVRVAQEMVAEVGAMAAHLPTDEDQATA